MKTTIVKVIIAFLEEKQEETKEEAYAFFNKCDLHDLIKNKICLVEFDRRDSFIKYANEKGVNPCGGAFTKTAQYFYI